MKVSMVIARQEIEEVIQLLISWRNELSAPVEVQADGSKTPVYPDGVPPGLRVEELEGIDGEALRAELLLCSGKLELLAHL